MNRHVVVGTAGHVDHGKTALVKALTGTDTDRWEEEKRRGITIDLGFASVGLADGLTASIVDVPGHEDFVRNMVAGATGVDVALLVVAADEGVMPQTVEHLAILEFLGVRSGVLVISKVDLVDDDWLELVLADIAERTGDSSVMWEPPVLFCATEGRGLDELKTVLTRAAGSVVERSEDDVFRMPVDRVFSAAGAGTVVTGTTWSGTVATGSEVRILPGDTKARVRSIEVFGEASERAQPGRRTALALPGIDKNQVSRGCVVVTEKAWPASTALDVMVTLLPEARSLSQRSRIRVHLGTAEVMARVTPATEAIAPGETGAARLRLEMPLVARWGDRGVLRSYSPVATIGGCQVVDPTPPLRPRRPVGLHARAVADAVERLVAFVTASGSAGFAREDLVVRAGVHPGEADEVVRRAVGQGVTAVGDRLLPADLVDRAQKECLERLAAYHSEHPLDSGMPLELLRTTLQSPDIADHVLLAAQQDGSLVLDSGIARLVGFTVTLSGQDEQGVTALREALVKAGPHGVTEAELEEAVGARSVRSLVEYLARQGVAVRVGRDRYYDARAAESLRDLVLDEVRERGRVTPAEVRARTGLTRKYLIPFLEWLDSTGYTVRDGDGRRLGPRSEVCDSDS